MNATKFPTLLRTAAGIAIVGTLAACERAPAPTINDASVQAHRSHGLVYYVVVLPDGTRCVTTGSRGGVDCDWVTASRSSYRE